MAQMMADLLVTGGKVKVRLAAVDEYREWICEEDGSRFCRKDGASVQASTEAGQCWHHTHRFETEEAAWTFICRVQLSGSVIDVDKDCWVEGSFLYGSILYQRSGMEQQWAERERMEAAWD